MTGTSSQRFLLFFGISVASAAVVFGLVAVIGIDSYDSSFKTKACFLPDLENRTPSVEYTWQEDPETRRPNYQVSASRSARMKSVGDHIKEVVKRNKHRIQEIPHYYEHKTLLARTKDGLPTDHIYIAVRVNFQSLIEKRLAPDCIEGVPVMIEIFFDDRSEFIKIWKERWGSDD